MNSFMKQKLFLYLLAFNASQPCRSSEAGESKQTSEQGKKEKRRTFKKKGGKEEDEERKKRGGKKRGGGEEPTGQMHKTWSIMC